ncbi:MAG: phosphatase PAP2 family protein, partial [Chloroflexota bacterium]|nr:phosphatase PAP2 family protein [Chloroflexota bacterium]
MEGVAALWRRLMRPFGRRDLLEASLVGLAFLLYFAVRGAVIDRPETAYFNALDIIGVQRKLGFFWEPDMQEWIIDKLFLVQAANVVYFWLHFPLIIAFGIRLYFNHRRKYTAMRDLLQVSGGIALIVYWLYPVAPPRELPQLACRFDSCGP